MSEIGVEIGDRVWRALEPLPSQPGEEPRFCVLGGNNFGVTEQGSRLVYIVVPSGLISMSAVAFDTAQDGAVGFCDEEVPENWIYFRVVGLSRKSKCAFLRPVAGDPRQLIEKELEAWRDSQVATDVKCVVETPLMPDVGGEVYRCEWGRRSEGKYLLVTTPLSLDEVRDEVKEIVGKKILRIELAERKDFDGRKVYTLEE